MLLLLPHIVYLMVISICHADNRLSPVVNTAAGQWRGQSVTSSPGRRVDVFLGVPFAAPPTGPLRFKPPAPANISSGEWNATSHKARCLEWVIPEDPLTPRVPNSEDCLYLSIYSPWESAGGEDQRYPVMMYVHGGGFYGGTGALYNFTNVAAKGVVVVSINYRLDVFGWLSTGDEALPGNIGLLDQAFALKWIKSNIRGFRGDPDDVTVFGGSAGAASVSLLTLSPKTRGTFQKAIMQSGSGISSWSSRTSSAESHAMAVKVGESLSCDVSTSQALVQCLQGVQAEVLINASVALQVNGSVSWMPVVDGSFLPDTPMNLLADRKSSIPTIRGYNRDDFSYLVPDPLDAGLSVAVFQYMVHQAVSYIYDSNVQELTVKVMQEYIKKDPNEAEAKELRDAVVDIFTDIGMVVPAAMEAKLFSRCGGESSYLYEFAHRPSFSEYAPWQGVVHTDEKGFVLGLPQGPDPFLYQDVDEKDRAVAELVTTLWTDFAKFGDPTPSAINGTVWPPYSSGGECDTPDFSGKLYVIKDGPEVTPFDREEKVIFWGKTLVDFDKFDSSGDSDHPNNSGRVARPSVAGILLSLSVMLTYLIK